MIRSLKLTRFRDAEASQKPSRLVPSVKIPRSPFGEVNPIFSCACGGGCPRCQHTRLPVQTKLKVGAPGDKYEQEADRVAEMVMRMPEPGLQRKPT